MNTYGFFSIGHSSFNQGGSGVSYNRSERNFVTCGMALANLAFRGLSYSVGWKTYGSLGRMALGAGMIGVTVSIGLPDEGSGEAPINGHFYWEALGTGFFQLIRGGLDLWIPHGRVFNSLGDLVGSVVGMAQHYMWQFQSSDMGRPSPHSDSLLLYVIGASELLVAVSRRSPLTHLSAVGSRISAFLSPLAS